jgi:chromosome segregation protein
MFLQKLEIQGFKSFVDKTVVEFGNGITGVVGPNGCGKTNVSDAIRWVLGEQSARQLRGDSMEDVIFNGCPSRKPIGMAEVHVTFRNDRGILPTEFSEVTIARRVFRSGVSEYFINKTPCRLKDIKDLFFDTGMGSNAYSVIERQMVDHVLSDNSGHRRFLFEEASGITKYKARKRETLAKLEATEGDLTRVNDIVFEIERELRSLARQVGKARRYQRLRDGIRDLDLRLTSGRVLELRRAEADDADRWQEEAVRREGVTARLDGLEAELTARKLALIEIERELSTAQAGLKDREQALLSAEHQIVLLEERAAGLTRRAEEAAAEVARMRERLAETAETELCAAEGRERIRRQTDELRTQLTEREREFEGHDAELRRSRTMASDHKQLSLDLFSTEAEKRGACQRVLERAHYLTERRVALEQRRESLEQRAAERDQVVEAAGERRADLERELESARARLAATHARLETVDAGIHEADAALSAARQTMAAAESRLNVLLELKRNFEGVSEGVKSVFHDPERSPGLVGVLADVIDIPGDSLDAIEAALGEAAAFVLVEGPDALRASRDRLRALGTGRATLIDVRAQASRTLPALPSSQDVRGRASDLVRCDEAYRPLVERLLGNVVLVTNAQAAEELADRHEGLRFVSPEGEVWDRGRVRAGVTGAGGLLHREREIRELNGQLAEQSLGLEGLEHDRDGLQAERQAALQERAAAEAEADERRTALEGVVREVEAVGRERDWARSEVSEVSVELATVEAENASLDRARVEAEQELAQFQQDLERARAQLSDLDGAVRTAETRRDEASSAVQELRERLLGYGREELECETAWARAEQTRRELEHGIETRTGEERQSLAETARIQAELGGLRAGLGGLRDTESAQRERVGELQTRFQEAKSEVGSGEEVSRALRFEQTELSELLHSIELDRVQHRAELDRTFERLRTEYELDVQAWTPETPPEDFDAEAAGRELEASRQRLRTLGAVNLLALEEYTRKKDRWQFLTSQREDLQNARAQLLEAIEKINVTASRMFVETFEKVQGHFRDIFLTLFEGGDAELRAVGEDPLECEIEIAAKPRGKFLQSISLMSGGERALTAIALLFAIYLVKPSPFCLLDEVDAPLDDANVERFVRMLKRFSDRTQFVVITHNKKTMEAARCLYGVTMQELGVSKLVSVRFDRDRAENGNGSRPEAATESHEEVEASV